MLLKRLSFSLLMFLCFNICSMEKQNDEKPGEEKTLEQASVTKPAKAKKLKFLCAQQILKDNTPTKILPEELKNYLNYFDKFKELKKHTLAPVFKKYLINCFAYLSFEELKEILNIIDKANEISKSKCLLIQRVVPGMCKTVFCDNPLITLVGLALNFFPNSFGAKKLEIFEEIRKFYSDMPVKLENDDLPYKQRYPLAMLDFIQLSNITLNAPCIKFIISSAKKGYAPAIYKLGLLQVMNQGMIYGISTIKELIKVEAIDDASEFISFVMANTAETGLFDSELEFLQRQDFCDYLSKLISLILNENNYKPDYDQALALMYNYLKDKVQAKKYAKRYLTNNEGAICIVLHKLLRDIYNQEMKSVKEIFHADKVEEFQNLLTD